MRDLRAEDLYLEKKSVSSLMYGICGYILWVPIVIGAMQDVLFCDWFEGKAGEGFLLGTRPVYWIYRWHLCEEMDE